jgi:hypothetical protein
VLGLVTAAALIAISCGPAFYPPPADYTTHVVLTVGAKSFNFTGLGDCYAAATLFTFGLNTEDSGDLAFSVTMDVGPHRIDAGDTTLDWPGADDWAGTITVNHWNSRDRADGELAATSRSGTLRGHWGCLFSSH